MELYFKKEGYELVGAAMEVYNVMGPGFLEEVYQEAMELEMDLRKISFESQPPLELSYKGQKLKKFYRPDLFVCNSIIVELKAEKALTSRDESQLLNYLKGSGVKVGYLLNFGYESKLESKRMVL